MTSEITQDPGRSPPADEKMPRGIPFIVGNEFAERFCYYGINAILTIYMTRFLRIGDADATFWHHAFKSGAYFFPLIGAIVSDVFWGKFKTIMTFSLAYVAGCAVVALVPGTWGLFGGLTLVAFGTGGIKPCVSTNVGDQFTSKNQHLIERAFSYFYLAINAGSSISIYACPWLLDKYGRTVAFGIPAAMMFFATVIFWLGRNQYVHVPPAGKKWAKDIFDDLKRMFTKGEHSIIANLALIYLFIACFWALWDQSNGQTWTLQAESSLMDKNIGFGFTLLPAQIQVVNGLLILGMVPIFTFGVYPLLGKLFEVTPIRKIGIGLFTIAASFFIVSWIEGRIQGGHVVSAWWQILAYVVLTASEILVSITGLEFSYKQAPLRMKSFIMAMFLLAVSLGNFMAGIVDRSMIKPLDAVAGQSGAATWIVLKDARGIVNGQKIDFLGKSGLTLLKRNNKGEVKQEPVAGTFLVAAVDEANNRIELMDVVDRKPINTIGEFNAASANVSTYKLVGPQYFSFFAFAMLGVGLLFIFAARLYRGKTHVREDA